MNENKFVKMLGVLSWIWLLVVHMSLLDDKENRSRHTFLLSAQIDLSLAAAQFNCLCNC